MIECISVSKIYTNGRMYQKALDQVSLKIEPSEFVAITGASGSGKTTLLNIIGGLDRPTEGKIYVDGISISDLTENELSEFRREKIGFVFQQYNLLSWFTVYENIVFPIQLGRKNPDVDFVMEVAAALGLEALMDQMPDTLSGGQQQRVAIARALCMRPLIVLADEPTGNLDSVRSREVISLMKELAAKYQQTVAVITHSPEVAAQAERRIEIADGKIVR